MDGQNRCLSLSLFASLTDWYFLKIARFLGIALVALVFSVSAAYASTGGGFTRSGLEGEYFANNNFAGAPAFTRYDVRVDFDWQGNAPGGSISPGYRDVGANNFSVRWSGQIIAKYNETYTFYATSDNNFQVFIKSAYIDTEQWTKVIDQRNSQPRRLSANSSGQYQFIAGRFYDIEIRYTASTGLAQARLEWQSPSTPREVIDPVHQMQANISGGVDYDSQTLFADATKVLRFWREVPGGNQFSPLDALGNPTSDADLGLAYGLPDGGGSYKLSFNGQADIVSRLGFQISNKAYDSATNTTTADLSAGSGDALELYFTNTRRNPNSPTNTGITNLQIMRPVSPGATASHRFGTLFTDGYKNMASYFTALRAMDMMGGDGGDELNGDWSQRRLPNQKVQTSYFDGLPIGTAWEYFIMLCNETGRDIYINVPFPANEDYFRNLALLLRDGSTVDGVRYPGLNSNLKIYVEYSNEVWNCGHYPCYPMFREAQREVAAGNSPLNYDGRDDWFALIERRNANQGVKISNAFRQVFGDAAMMSRVRPLIFWQYENANDTAILPLRFLNEYYDNGDGQQHVPNPHPPSYYFWGGGGASYYGVDSSAPSIDEIFNRGLDANYGDRLKVQATWAKMFGLKYVVYEGGLSYTDPANNGWRNPDNSIFTAAKFDPRAKNLHLVAQRAFDEAGGTFNSVLQPISCEPCLWSMSGSMYNLDTPTWQAHKEIINRLPAAETLGKPINAEGVTSINPDDCDMTSGWWKPANSPIFYGGWQTPCGDRVFMRGYVARVDAPGTYQINITVSSPGQGGIFNIYVDGSLIQTINVPQGDNMVVNAGSPNLSIGQHGILLKALQNAPNPGDYSYAANLRGIQITRTNLRTPALKNVFSSIKH